MPNIIRNVEQAMAKFFIRDEFGHDEKNSNIEEQLMRRIQNI